MLSDLESNIIQLLFSSLQRIKEIQNLTLLMSKDVNKKVISLRVVIHNSLHGTASYMFARDSDYFCICILSDCGWPRVT